MFLKYLVAAAALCIADPVFAQPAESAACKSNKGAIIQEGMTLLTSSKAQDTGITFGQIEFARGEKDLQLFGFKHTPMRTVVCNFSCTTKGVVDLDSANSHATLPVEGRAFGINPERCASIPLSAGVYDIGVVGGKDTGEQTGGNSGKLPWNGIVFYRWDGMFTP